MASLAQMNFESDSEDDPDFTLEADADSDKGQLKCTKTHIVTSHNAAFSQFSQMLTPRRRRRLLSGLDWRKRILL